MPKTSTHMASDSEFMGSICKISAKKKHARKFPKRSRWPLLPALCTSLGISLISASPAFAQVTGTVDVSIELTAACEVNGTPDTANVDFGDMVFPTQTTLFSQVDGALSAGATQGIEVICTPGLDASLKIGEGQNDLVRGSANRAMTNGTLFVPYNLYANGNRDTPLNDGDTIDIIATGTAQTIGLYGRAYGTSMLTAGSYTDRVSVSLEF